jgi:hypothetical protein
MSHISTMKRWQSDFTVEEKNRAAGYDLPRCAASNGEGNGKPNQQGDDSKVD